ncbi:protein of unknown function [Methanoculleus bourgensis]|uniref:Uncharacterized protein n=1 Tax=Methanoculleus bourgensis TaxID=83986 RepID=A0A0X3BLP3_9EURY|nr:protein of unknown function [Methanoculleus bourgensis]
MVSGSGGAGEEKGIREIRVPGGKDPFPGLLLMTISTTTQSGSQTRQSFYHPDHKRNQRANATSARASCITREGSGSVL